MHANHLRSILTGLLVLLMAAGAGLVARAGELPRAGGVYEAGSSVAFAPCDRDMEGAVAWGASPLPAPDATGADSRVSSISNWSAIGPFGGEIVDVAVSPTNPNLVLAGLAPSSLAGTLYLSHDAGSHWSEVTAFSNNSVYDIEFSPTGVIYVGTLESVWKSTNGGTNWTHLNLGIGLNDQVFEVSIDPVTESTVWVGVGDAMGAQAQTVLRSTNGGTTWVNRTPPMTPLSCRGIAFKRTDPNRVYACFAGGLGGGAIWVSSDGGTNWINRSAGLPNRPMNDVIHDGSRVLVCGGQLFGSQTFGLYASSNEGANWSALHNGWPSLVINDIAQDPNDARVLLAASQGRGVFRSGDSGVTWTYGIGGTDNFPVNSVRCAPGSSSRIDLGVNSLGVWRSLDGGGSFAATNTGIMGVNTYDIAANPLDPLEYAAAFQGSNDGGVYTSIDGGLNWDLEPLPGTRYNFVVFSPLGVLYAISDGPSSIAPEGVYRRNGDGTWACLGPDQGPLFETELRVALFSANNPALILAAGSDFGVAGSEGTAWISTDSGVTWAKSYEGPAGDIVFDLAWLADGTDLTVLGAVTNYSGSGGGALRTTDGGWNWASSSSGLAVDARGMALSSPPGQPSTFFYADAMYANGSGGLYKTTDAGLTWSPTGLVGTGSVPGVLCDPTETNTLYVLRPAPDRVLQSVDGGTTFSPFNTGMGASGTPAALGYAATPIPRLLCAGTRGGFATLLLTPEGIAGDQDPAGSALIAIPNPASTREGVHLSLPPGYGGAVRVFDAGGCLVRVIPRAAAEDPGLTRRVTESVAGQPVVFWDGRTTTGSVAAAGVYWARLSGGRSPDAGCRIVLTH